MDAEPRYRFRSTWRLPAPPERVVEALADVEGYPAWWPQVRRVRRLDADRGELTCRAVVPYDLVFLLTKDVEDRDRGLLSAQLSGGLIGWSRWTVSASRAGASATFEQAVSLPGGLGGLARRSGLLARAALRLNHDVMMRDGERGLRRQLATG